MMFKICLDTNTYRDEHEKNDDTEMNGNWIDRMNGMNGWTGWTDEMNEPEENTNGGNGGKYTTSFEDACLTTNQFYCWSLQSLLISLPIPLLFVLDEWA